MPGLPEHDVQVHYLSNDTRGPLIQYKIPLLVDGSKEMRVVTIRGADETQRIRNKKPLSSGGFELSKVELPEGEVTSWVFTIYPEIDDDSLAVYAEHLDEINPDSCGEYGDEFERHLPTCMVDSDDGIDADPIELFLEHFKEDEEETFGEMLARNNNRLCVPVDIRDYISAEIASSIPELGMEFIIELLKSEEEIRAALNDVTQADDMTDQDMQKVIDSLIKCKLTILPFTLSQV